MITSVNTVLVAQRCTDDEDKEANWKVGDLAMFDENKKFIKDEEAAAKAGSIYLGVITDSVDVLEPNSIDGATHKMPVFKWSSEIQKSGHPRATITDFSECKEEKVEIQNNNDSDDDAIVGHRYVLRIVYKDINEAPGQFTHTYEVYAKSQKFEDVFNELANKINKHKNRRVNAKVEAHTSSKKKLTLKALPKDDNDGVDSLNEYSQVSMEVTFYETIPGALLANQPKPIEDIAIVKTAGTPGNGNWKVVRDMERRYMGYTGHVFTGAYPSVEQKMLVEKDGKYDTLTIECDNLYLSNDNQYIKTTPITTTVYALKDHATEGLTKTTFLKLVEAFIKGEKAQTSEAA